MGCYFKLEPKNCILLITEGSKRVHKAKIRWQNYQYSFYAIFSRRKSRSEDARLKEILLTDKSLEIKKNIDKEIKKVEKTLRKGLTEEELKNFKNILDKMSKNLEE